MKELDELLVKIRGLADPDLGEDNARVSILDFGKSVHIDFHGSPFDEAYDCLCTTVVSKNVSDKLASLRLSSPADEGANGTRNWDLSPLLEATSFPLLRLLKIEQNVPESHNRVIVGSMYEEEGVLGLLLQKSPRLESLAVPSAPEIRFFGEMHRSLSHLSVDSGYDTQNFIQNLAHSRCFPSLRNLEFGEYNETYMESFLESCTSFPHYRELFESKAFLPVRNFTLRNPQLTETAISELRAMRPSSQLTLKIVKWSSAYIRAA